MLLKNKFSDRGIYEACRRIIVIGDIHGDIKKFISILKAAGVIEKKNSNVCLSEKEYDCDSWNWVGGDTRVVQVGDIFDGGGRTNQFDDHELETYNFLIKLKKKAQNDPLRGDVILIVGNHEIMNFNGNYNYVTDSSRTKCFSYENGEIHFKKDPTKKCFNDRDILFKIGGKLAISMSKNMDGIVRIGSNVFCHAGLNDNIAKKCKYNIPFINKLLIAFLEGKLLENNEKNQKLNKYYSKVYGSEGIIWNRDLAHNDTHQCNQLSLTLKKLGAPKGRMIVGHTVQKTINAKCSKSNFWIVDTGMSEAFNTDNRYYVQYLEILNDNEVIPRQAEVLNYC